MEWMLPPTPLPRAARGSAWRRTAKGSRGCSTPSLQRRWVALLALGLLAAVALPAPIAAWAAQLLAPVGMSARQPPSRGNLGRLVARSAYAGIEPGKQAKVKSALTDSMVCLTSSIFGFPDFRSLIELKSDGSVHFSGGMIAEEPGAWSIEAGQKDEEENPNDLYLKFTQPLTKRYAKIFSVPGGTCFWKAKVAPSKRGEAVFEDGMVVSATSSGNDVIREGTFTAKVADEELVAEVRARAREAFEKALTAKGESTGFKTPARIAGVARKQFGGEKKSIDQKSTTSKPALKSGDDDLVDDD